MSGEKQEGGVTREQYSQLCNDFEILVGQLESKIRSAYGGELPDNSRAVATLNRYKSGITLDLPCKQDDNLQDKANMVTRMTARIKIIIANFNLNKDSVGL